MSRLLRSILTVAAALALASCQSIGPPTLARDRLDYGGAIAESWKHQTLLNIVKLRYSDPPLFVDIGQIVGGYSLETSVNLAAKNATSSRERSVNTGARFTDRPTVTYTPLTGQAFLTGLVTPISPASLVTAIQVGWPAETILPVGVVSINGISNERLHNGVYQEADPDFERVVSLIAVLQKSGDLIFRSRQRGEGQKVEMYLRKPTPANRDAKDELRRLLGLAEDAVEFDVVFGERPMRDGRVSMKTRSILYVLQLLATRVDIPPEHVSEGRATAGAPHTADQGYIKMQILSSEKPPEDAFVEVNYRDMWFYIDDRDMPSKRLFALLMLLFTLADKSTEQSAPVLTIPTG